MEIEVCERGSVFTWEWKCVVGCVFAWGMEVCGVGSVFVVSGSGGVWYWQCICMGMEHNWWCCLQSRRDWRDERLAALAKLKKDMQKQEEKGKGSGGQ